MNLSAVQAALETTPPAGGTRARLRRVLFAAFLDPSQKFGTLEEQICLQARAFRERGSLFLPLFLTAGPADRAVPEFRDAGVAVECLDLTRFSWGSCRRLLRLVSEHRIEVVHWNFTQPLNNPYLWALSLLRPMVSHYYTDHNSRTVPGPRLTSLLRRAVKRALLKRYEKVIGVSEFVRASLHAEGCWPNLSTCLHFVNTDRFRPDGAARREARQRLGAAGRFVLLAVAYLIEPKGVDVAVRALARLPDDVTLWVVGTGRQAEALRALAGQLGVAARTHFLGAQRYVEPYMQAADCLVCPSLWAEAAGLVNLEALACGLPVVASRIGGIPEYVEDGRTGLLFAPGDADGLAECLLRLRGDPDYRDVLARQAWSRAVERFSAHSRLDDFLALYRIAETVP
jgi:glycosyltransferase involved in cell wall biosynthesis